MMSKMLFFLSLHANGSPPSFRIGFKQLRDAYGLFSLSCQQRRSTHMHTKRNSEKYKAILYCCQATLVPLAL